MPIPASELGRDAYSRLLILGESKLGKTTTAVSTAPPPVRLLLCEDKSAANGARRETLAFDAELVQPNAAGDIYDLAVKYIVAAKDDARKKKIASVVLDPLSFLADNLLEEAMKLSRTKQGNEDGRAAHGLFKRRYKHIIDLLLTIPAHVIVVSHFEETTGEDGEDGSPSGRGIVPLLPNRWARKWTGSAFHDVVRFEVSRGSEKSHKNRVFVTETAGWWGPGCRSKKGSHVLPAHVGQFIEWCSIPEPDGEDYEPPKPKAMSQERKVSNAQSQ